ncbi:MAG: hypothetical protein LBM97_01570 [Candidatus Nomurabacteria bacterium]|jgi:hypothetical protein|nr:hypothetical protein [Candidatus Nomurabacteria bacterium]
MSELPDKQIKRLKNLLQEAETNLAAAREMLSSIIGEEGGLVTVGITQPGADIVGGRVIEGFFDGQQMIGQDDGKIYPVPANYASKSKLVEGDILKLTITEAGKMIYKQIGPVPRKQVIGTLKTSEGKYSVEVGGREYAILLASVTYFRIAVGQQVAIFIPEANDDASWAAVEAAL